MFEVSIGRGNILRETPKAILVSLGSDAGTWLPKSQITIDIPEGIAQAGVLIVPVWLAERSWSRTGLWTMVRAGSARFTS